MAAEAASERRCEALLDLASLLGIEHGYWDVDGGWHPLEPLSAQAILSAFGLDASSEESAAAAASRIRSERAGESIPPVVVAFRSELPVGIPIRPPYRSEGSSLAWELFEEGGKISSGERLIADLDEQANSAVFHLPLFPSDGYHYLRIAFRRHPGEPYDAGGGCRVIVAPDRCYLPPALERGERWWGVGAQLPALRSARSWGIGDFSDLVALGRLVGERGGKFIGVNPLHALPPGGKSPYSPNSRFEIQPLYIDVSSLPEYASAPVATFLKSKKIQRELSALSEAAFVDYGRVWKLKRSCLQIIYDVFLATEVKKGTDRSIAFHDYLDRRGERLKLFAIHSALAESIEESGGSWAWHRWPVKYQDPQSPEVRAFAAKNAEQVGFFEFLSWVADTQLSEACSELERAGVQLGCYGDQALGSDPAGAENWIDQHLFVRGVSLGAPPDALGPLGQVWGLPALSPERLRADGYELFASLLRRQMRYAGALRLDHVMSLHRLFVVPSGMHARDGAYLRYSLHDLSAIVALESQRNKTVIIGEDLGTVPEEVSAAMRERRMLSYKVLYFMKHGSEFVPPSAYPSAALVVTSTHDLPTLAGFISGTDIGVREDLGLWTAEQAGAAAAGRKSEVETLLRTVQLSGNSSFGEINVALHRELASTPCLLQLVQIEDVLGQLQQCNVPGTVDEHPNWQRRYSVPLEELRDHAGFSGVLAAVAAARC